MSDILVRVCCNCGYIMGFVFVAEGQGGQTDGIGPNCCFKLYGIKAKENQNAGFSGTNSGDSGGW